MVTMASKTMLSLLAGAGLLLASARAACYDTWGNEDPNQLPCFAPGAADTTATTWCCNKDDYCLSNGLCLSPGANNLMTQQGCTDQNWGEGCQKFCPAPSQQDLVAAKEIPLVPCPASLDSASNGVKFCCGPDAASCCETPSAWSAIPAGSIIRVPSTFSAALPGGGDSLAHGGPQGSSADALKMGLGIGLGVGVPVLLALLAVAYLLARPLLPHRLGGFGGGALRKPDDDDEEKFDGRRRRRRPTPSRQTAHRRDSFGKVDTHVGPPSDDGHWDGAGGGAEAWPPSGSANVAAAIAAWARAGAAAGGGAPPVVGVGGAAAGAANYGVGVMPGMGGPLGMGMAGSAAMMEPPPSPKEMDGRCRSRSQSRGGFRGGRETPIRVAELPVDDGEVAGFGTAVGGGMKAMVEEVDDVDGVNDGRPDSELPTYSPDSDVDVESGVVRGEKR